MNESSDRMYDSSRIWLGRGSSTKRKEEADIGQIRARAHGQSRWLTPTTTSSSSTSRSLWRRLGGSCRLHFNGTWSLITALLLLLIVCLSADLVRGDTMWDRCEPCNCKWVSGKKMAECLAKGLTTIPRNLSSDLQVIDLSYNGVPEIRRNEFIEANLPNLHKLFMRNCTIQLLHRGALNGLDILIELDLSDNQLRELPVGLFDPLARLRTVMLNRNEIQVIEDDLFRNMVHLHKVELKENRIHAVGLMAFVNLPALAQIYLDMNRLTTLKKETFESLDKLTSLSIMHNPWNCTCDLEQFRDFIITRNLYINPTCAEPRELAGKSWTELSAENFACRPRITRIRPANRFRSSGENETLECEISASPRPEIYWLFNKKPLNNYDNRYRMRAIESYKKSGSDVFITRLTIVGMKGADKGTYTCVASNRGGKDEGHIAVDRSSNGGGGIFLTSSDGGSDSGRSPLGNIYVLIILIIFIVLLVLAVTVLLYCCCKRRWLCLAGINAKTYKKNKNNNNHSMMSENGLIHSKLNDKQLQNESMIEGGSVIMEMQKSLLTEVNPVEKPPRRTELDANGGSGCTYNDIMDEKAEIKKTLLDETAFGSHDDETQSVALSDTTPRSRQTFVDDGYGTNLPPDLLSFPAGYMVAGDLSQHQQHPQSQSLVQQQPRHSPSVHNSIQNIVAADSSLYGGVRSSPMGSPIYGGTMSHHGGLPSIYGTTGGNRGFRTLPHQKYSSQTLAASAAPMRVTPHQQQQSLANSRTQSPFTPGPILYQPLLMKQQHQQQGYVTIPRKPRTPSWAPSIGSSSTATNVTHLESLQLMGGGQNDEGGMNSPGGPLSPTNMSMVSTGGEFEEPVYDNLGLRTTASGNSVLNLTKLSLAKSNNYSMKDRPLPATPGQQVPAAGQQLLDNSGGSVEPLYDSSRPKKVPPLPPPKPQKRRKQQTLVTSNTSDGGNVNSQLYQDEGEDGTEV